MSATGSMLRPDAAWTRETVAARLEEAAATLRGMPSVRAQGFFSTWPPVLQNCWEAYGWTDEKPRRGPATPEAIDRMDETLQWFGWLARDETELVWLRAERIGWKVICARFGVGRTTAWMRWTMSLEKVAARLNHSVRDHRSPRRV